MLCKTQTETKECEQKGNNVAMAQYFYREQRLERYRESKVVDVESGKKGMKTVRNRMGGPVRTRTIVFNFVLARD